FSSRRRHTRSKRDWSSDVCSSDLDALVRLVQDWSLRYPLAQGQGNFGSPGNDPAAAPRYTETKLATIAMEMLRDIDQETVDFAEIGRASCRERVAVGGGAGGGDKT